MNQQTPPLNIQLFGSMHVQQHGKPITDFASRKAEALLAYLLLNPHAHARDTLADLLWDDRTQKQALGNLRVLLSNLRKLFPDLLHINRQTVQFNADTAVNLDTAILQTAMAQLEDGLLNEETAVSLTAAFDAYHGTLLSGLYLRDARRFEAWLLIERERWQRIARRGLQQLAQYQFNSGDLATAEQTARRLVKIDPLREQSQQLLMRVLAQQGNSNLALQQYQHLVELLDNELGVPPAPETERLYQRIRQVRLGASFALPPETSPLLGRQDEVIAIQQRLDDRATRLVTLLGIGGIGKTRLAVHVAHQRQKAYLHGVCFVPLATATDENSMLTLLAQALKVDLGNKETAQTQLLNFLRAKEMLLVLDNAEQIVDEVVAWIRPLLTTAPDIQLLITSRERLQLREEWVYPLTGLASASVQLVQERAAQFAPDLPTNDENERHIAQICQLVDGVPLALELAAAGLAYHSPAEMVAALQKNLDFLRTQLRDVPERHRSMRAVFAHSWQLLTPAEQTVYAQLSVFRGGFTLAEAAAITNTDRLMVESLLAQSLIQRQSNGRYHLHELLRQFAAEKLSAKEAKSVQQKHAAYFGDYLHTHLAGMEMATHTALQAIAQAFENIQAAWQTVVEGRDETAVFQLLDGFTAYFYVRGFYHPGLTMLNQAQTAFAEANHQLKAHIRVRQALFLGEVGEYKAAVAAADEAVALVKDGGETAVFAIASLCRGFAHWAQGEYDTAKPHLQQAIDQSKAIPLHWVTANSLNSLGNVYLDQGDLTNAKLAYSQVFDIASAIGHQRVSAIAHISLGNTFWHMGEYSLAYEQFEQALHICQTVGIRKTESLAHLNMGLVDSELNRHESSMARIQQALAISREVGDRRGEGNALLNLLVIYMEQAQYGKVIEWLPDALAISRDVGDQPGTAIALDIEAQLNLLTGDFKQSAQVLTDIWELCERVGDSWGLMECCISRARLFWHMGALAESVAQAQDGIARARELSDQTNEAKGLSCLAHGRFSQQQYADALTAYDEAIALWQSLGQPHLTLECEVGRLFALYCLKRPFSHNAVDSCVGHLLSHPLHGLAEPGRALYMGYLLLTELDDARAEQVRARGVAFLRETAVAFVNAQQQEAYLHTIGYHHGLMTAPQSKNDQSSAIITD